MESILQEIVAINQSLTDKEKKMELTKNCMCVCVFMCVCVCVRERDKIEWTFTEGKLF